MGKREHWGRGRRGEEWGEILLVLPGERPLLRDNPATVTVSVTVSSSRTVTVTVPCALSLTAPNCAE